MGKVFEKIRVEGAKIRFRNFSGAEGQYNKAGDRNFELIISDPNEAQRLTEEGWNVRIKPIRNGEETIYVLKVKVNMDVKPGRKPVKAVLIVNGMQTELDAESIGILDAIDYNDIQNIDLVIRPYNYDVSGKSGVAAYLEEIWVTQSDTGFSSKYSPAEDFGF